MHLKIFIKRPILATVISLIIVLCGIVALYNMPMAQFPDISPPSISISASYPGANAETAARVVASQIENQLNGVSNLTYMSTSTSSTGGISITLTYDVGTNLNYAINEVLNRLYAAMPLLPSVVQRIGVTARKSSPDILMFISFYSDPYIDPEYVSNYLERTLENDLSLLPTVGTVRIFGTGPYAMRLWLDPNKMQRYGLTVSDVQAAVKDQNYENFVGKSNAAPNENSQNLSITMRGSGMYSKPEQFANIVLKNKNNQIVRVNDIARVELGANSYSTIAEVDFRDKNQQFKHYPCSVVMVALLPGANQLEAKKQILNLLKQDSRGFPKGLHYKIFVDYSNFVLASIKNVLETLKVAFFLVALVIFIFLQNYRASLIAICSIPVSIVGTMAFLYLFGFSLNTLSLFALILAIGIVVDDAIVIIENIERLRHEYPNLPFKKIVAMTLDEVFGAIVAIVLVLSVVFIPVMGLGGLSGIMYRQFAVTIACAVILSGICALTFTPAMSSVLLAKPNKQWRLLKFLTLFDKGFTKLTNLYLHFAAIFIRHQKTTCIIWVVIVLLTLGMFKLIPLGFVPNEDQGLVFATLNLPSSSSLQDTDKAIEQFVEKLTKNPSIDSVITVTGWDFLDSGNVKTYAASFFIALKDWNLRTAKGSSADDVIAAINKLGMQKGMVVRAFNQPPIRGLSVTGGVEFYVEDRIFGDPHKLQQVTAELIKRLMQHKEVIYAFQLLDTNVLEISIVPNIAMANFYGVSLPSLYNAVQTMYSDNYINYAYIMQDITWVIMQSDYPYRATINNLDNVFIHTNRSPANEAFVPPTSDANANVGENTQSQHTMVNNMIPIAAVVNVTYGRDAQVIQRFNDYMASKVIAYPAPFHSMGDVMKVVTEEAAKMPKGYDYDWYGTSYQQTLSQKTSVLAFIFSIAMIYLVLSALYEMWRLPLVVLMGVPFALFGAGLVLLASFKQNDLYFQISLIALLGLSAKNIILLIEFALQHFNQRHDATESALHALKLRFRPIVMTSMTFVFGTLPLIFAHGAGANAQHSVGIGIIGGILGSVILATLFTPAYFVLIMQNYKKHV